MATRDALSALLPRCPSREVGQAAHAFDELSRSVSHDWQQLIIKVFSDSVARNGLEGVHIAQKGLADMLDGRRVDLNFVDLRTASDLLAIMQNARIDRKQEVEAYMRKVGRNVGIVLRSILGGLIGV